MRSMSVIIVRIASSDRGCARRDASRCYRINAIDIVYVSVAIIIQPVSGNFAGICPHISAEVLMRVPDAGVGHRHNYIVGCVLVVPTFRRINVGVGRAAVLPGVVE